MALSSTLRELVSQSANKYKGGNEKTAKPKDGRNVYRILPNNNPADTSGKFWRDLGVHWIKADENGKPIAVVGDCDTVYQKPSMINAVIDQAVASAIDEDSKTLFESWRPRRSVLINVINRSENSMVEVLELTPTTFGKVLDLIMLYDGEGHDVLDFANGIDLVISKSGKGLNTSYEVTVQPLAPGKTYSAVTKEQMDKAVNLDEFIERNYFRGEETKAINAIAQISGISVPTGLLTRNASSTALPPASPSTPAPALTSTGAAVAGAAAAPSPSAEDLALAERRRKILEDQQRAAAELAELEAQAAAKPVASAPASDSSLSDLPADEQDAILKALEDLK